MPNIDIFVVPDIWNVVAQWAATLILFLVIRHFVYTPMNDFLEKRKDRVIKDLDEAESKKKEALDMKAEYEKEISNAQQEAREIIEASRKRAAILKKEEEEEAKRQAQSILEKARLQIASEKKMASEEVRDQVAEMALLIARKVLTESVDLQVQEDLIDGFIKDLEHNHVH